MPDEPDQPEARPAPIDLAFATDEELMDELGKRFNGAVFASEKASRGKDELETDFRWYGSLSLAIGLASRVHHRLLQASDRAKRLSDPDAGGDDQETRNDAD